MAIRQMMKIANIDQMNFFSSLIPEKHSGQKKQGQEQFSDAESILSQRYVEYVDPSEI